jgi:hypothetical protein
LDFQTDTNHSFLRLMVFPVFSVLILPPFLFQE